MPWHDYIHLGLLTLAIGGAYAILALGIITYVAR